MPGLRMAQIYEALGKTAKANGLRAKARQLFQKFNEAFWDEAGGFYAYCLDGDKKPILTVTSNPGHLLWCGIVPEDRAERVVRRLMQPDMWSGWGHPHPLGRQPRLQPLTPTSAARSGRTTTPSSPSGFRRYGYIAEAHQIAADVTNASSYFALSQMPELYAGIQREPENFPGPVPRRQCSAGLGGGLVLPSPGHDRRLPAQRGGGSALPRSCLARLDARPHALRPSRGRSGVRYPLLARWPRHPAGMSPRVTRPRSPSIPSPAPPNAGPDQAIKPNVSQGVRLAMSPGQGI